MVLIVLAFFRNAFKDSQHWGRGREICVMKHSRLKTLSFSALPENPKEVMQPQNSSAFTELLEATTNTLLIVAFGQRLMSSIIAPWRFCFD